MKKLWGMVVSDKKYNEALQEAMEIMWTDDINYFNNK